MRNNTAAWGMPALAKTTPRAESSLKGAAHPSTDRRFLKKIAERARAAPRHGDLAHVGVNKASHTDLSTIKHSAIPVGSPHHGPTMRGLCPIERPAA